MSPRTSKFYNSYEDDYNEEVVSAVHKSTGISMDSVRTAMDLIGMTGRHLANCDFNINKIIQSITGGAQYAAEPDSVSPILWVTVISNVEHSFVCSWMDSNANTDIRDPSWHWGYLQKRLQLLAEGEALSYLEISDYTAAAWNDRPVFNRAWTTWE